VDDQPAGGTQAGWAGAAGTVRLLTAVLLGVALLGVALLGVALLGQGVAAASAPAMAAGGEADGGSLTGVGGDGVPKVGDPATPTESGSSDDGSDRDFQQSVDAATSTLEQPAPPAPQPGAQDGEFATPAPQGAEPDRPETATSTVPKWAQLRLEERPQPASPPGPTEDGEDDPASPLPDAAAGTSIGRGVDVYLAIGGPDQPGVPYILGAPALGTGTRASGAGAGAGGTHSGPAGNAGDTTTTTTTASEPPPPDIDELAGWRWDLNALADADRSFGPLDQYPRDDQGVVQLPAVTVTAVPITRPEQGERAPLAADATPRAPQDDAANLVSVTGGQAASRAGPDAGPVGGDGAPATPTGPEDPVADQQPQPAGASAAGRTPAAPVGQHASGSTLTADKDEGGGRLGAAATGTLAPPTVDRGTGANQPGRALAWAQDGWSTLAAAGLLAGDVEAAERPAAAAGAEPQAEPLTWVGSYPQRQGCPDRLRRRAGRPGSRRAPPADGRAQAGVSGAPDGSHHPPWS
jgi:hypothetical protein